MADNKALVRRFVEEFQMRGDVAVCAELVAPDVVDHSAPPGIPPGRAGVVALFDGFRTAFAELRIEIHDMLAEGDQVVSRKTVHAKHVGDFMGMPATGRTVAFAVIDIVRIADGRIVEHWSVTDQLGLLQQLS